MSFDNKIGSELVNLQGKFEIVSENCIKLSRKIETETSSIVSKIEELKKGTVEQVDHIFSRKFGMVIGSLLGGLSILFGSLKFVAGYFPGPNFLMIAAVSFGVAILLVTYIVAIKTK